VGDAGINGFLICGGRSGRDRHDSNVVDANLIALIGCSYNNDIQGNYMGEERLWRRGGINIHNSVH